MSTDNFCLFSFLLFSGRLEEEEREQKGRVHETQLAYERAHGAKTEGKQQAKILVEKLSTLTEKQMELEADVRKRSFRHCDLILKML